MAYGLDLPLQNAILKKAADLFSRIRVNKYDEMLPFQKGIVGNCKALPMMLKTLKKE